MLEFGEAVVSENHAKVEELMHRVGVPTSWRLLPRKPEVEWPLDTTANPESGWGHLRGGVWWSQLDLKDPNFTLFEYARAHRSPRRVAGVWETDDRAQVIAPSR